MDIVSKLNYIKENRTYLSVSKEYFLRTTFFNSHEKNVYAK